MPDDKKLFLLDAYALVYRAYFAFIRNPRYNSKGMNTSAVFGFANTLVDVLTNESPTHIAVVFDPPGPTFRNELYKEYKANREETPEDIKKSIPYVKRMIEGFNIPIIEMEGYEADDVIGALARQAETKGYTTYMMTPDKDYCQLVDQNTLIYKPAKGGKKSEVWDIDKVREQFMVDEPRQVIDVLALWGDSSDNVPGVPGVGEKTAKKLIAQFKSVENLLANTGQLKGKQKENVEASADQLKLSKNLVTIRTDLPVELNEDELQLSEADAEKLNELFTELEFRNLGQRLFGAPVEKKAGTPQQQDLFSSLEEEEAPALVSELKTIENTEHEYILVERDEDIKALAEKLGKLEEFCFDTETSGLDVHQSDLVGLSLSWEAHKAYYIHLPDKREEAKEKLSHIRFAFEDEDVIKCGQNLKFDILALRNYGIKVNGKLFDTMLAHYLIQPELRHNLDYLSETYLGYKPVSIEELIGKRGKNQGSMCDVEVEKLKEYAAEDADLTWQLRQKLAPELKEKGQDELYWKIEAPLITVLADIEAAGVKVDKAILDEYAQKLGKEIERLEKEIYELAGETFLVSSPKQLGEILFDKLKIVEKPKKTRTKQYSTAEDYLQSIADKHPIIPKIFEYRGFVKLMNTYVEALPKLINPRTGRIHTSYNQAVTATGRLSSTSPNLQNIPIREDEGREIRKAFVPADSGHVLFAADYSQIELRLMAHLSGDEAMIEAFRDGRDIHTATAARIYGKNLDEVDGDLRRKAKTANFGIIYGISAFGLSQRLSIPRGEAAQIIEGYFRSYPGVKKYMDSAIEKARKRGYVETIEGRRRYLRDINSRNGNVRGMAERNAINAPIQGTAADIIKLAMIAIQEEIKNRGLQSRMIMQVHDELVFDVPKGELDELRELAVNLMEGAATLSVPLTVDHGTGNTWLEAH